MADLDIFIEDGPVAAEQAERAADERNQVWTEVPAEELVDEGAGHEVEVAERRFVALHRLAAEKKRGQKLEHMKARRGHESGQTL